MLADRIGPWLPSLLRRRLLRAEAQIEDAVRALAALLPRGSRVLDAGAGEGRYRALFAHCRYSGVDRAIGDSRWDYSQLDSIADLSELPFADESFDALINLVVLEHVFEPNRVLKEFARVLKPGARVLIAVPLAWEVHQAPHDYFRYTCHGLRRLLTEAGLRVETIRPMGGFFTLLARRLLNSMIFFQRGLLWVLFPVVAAVAGAIALILPALDVLDRDKNFTLGYVCLAEKPPSAPGGSSQ